MGKNLKIWSPPPSSKKVHSMNFTFFNYDNFPKYLTSPYFPYLHEQGLFNQTLYPEVQKGLGHGSIPPRRKWTELIMTEGVGTSLPHLS